MVEVRRAVLGDAAAMARVHVRAWQEAYRGLMRDEVLDAPDAVARREAMWGRILGDVDGGWRSAVADADGEVVGIAGSQRSDDPAGRLLVAIYLLAVHHGSGAGVRLLDATLPRDEPVWLRVTDPNPRAQAFYRREGFTIDGDPEDEDGVRVLRMVRTAR